MILDQNLTFHHHIDSLIDNITAELNLSYKTRWLFDQGRGCQVYKSLILHYIDVSCIMYEIAPQYQLQRLETVQNAAARPMLLCDPKYLVYELHDRRKLNMLVMGRATTMVRTT